MGDLCVFCYKSGSSGDNDLDNVTGISSGGTKQNELQVKRFVALLESFCDGDDTSTSTKDDDGVLGRPGCLQCCQGCLEIIEAFCVDYQKLQSLLICLESELDSLVCVMKRARKIPSRLTKLGKLHDKAAFHQCRTTKIEQLCEQKLASFQHYRERIINKCGRPAPLSTSSILLKESEDANDFSNISSSTSAPTKDNCVGIYDSSYPKDLTWPSASGIEIKQEADISEEEMGKLRGANDQDITPTETDVKLEKYESNSLIDEVGPEDELESGSDERDDLELCQSERQYHLREKSKRLDVKAEEDDEVSGDNFSDPDDNYVHEETIITSSSEEDGKKVNSIKKVEMTLCSRVRKPIPSSPSPSQSKVKLKRPRKNKSAHGDVTCSICSKKFVSGRRLREHMKCVHCPPTHLCTECGKLFKTEHLLARHALKHTDKSSWKFPCSICTKRFYTRSHLNQHMEIGHPERSDNICKVCHQKFDTAHQLKTHTNRYHTEQIHQCNDCGKIYPSIRSLNQHLKMHKNPEEWKYQCSTCGMKHYTKSRLDAHMLTHLKGSKEFECQYCSEKFRTRNAHDLHMKTEHIEKGRAGKSKIVQCPKCDMKYIAPNVLRHHMNSVHVERTQQCSECPKAFKTAANLKQHSLTHQDASTWKSSCSTCGKKYHSRKDLDIHIMNVH